jgi:hypothetical protein
MRPHFGHIKDVPAVLLGLFRSHNLNVHVPFRIISLLDGFEKILDMIIGVFSGDTERLLCREILDPQG